MNKKLLFLFIIVVVFATIYCVIWQTEKDTSISEPPQTPKTLLNPTFLVVPMETENVKVIHAGYSKSNWIGMDPGPNAYMPPAKDCYTITFRINRKTKIEPTEIWVKNQHTIPIEIYQNGYLIYNPSSSEVDVTISAAISTKDINYTIPPKNFEGEALVEILINGKKEYFVIKKFQQMLPQ